MLKGGNKSRSAYSIEKNNNICASSGVVINVLKLSAKTETPANAQYCNVIQYYCNKYCYCVRNMLIQVYGQF